MSQASAAPLRCSYAADERGDPLAATAAPASGFLLIESPGAWGHDILSQSRLDPEIAALVAARAVGLSYRLILIKRPGRVLAHGPRRWVLVDSAPGAERMTWGTYDADSDLLEIPLEHTEHEEAPTPLYLVCTHGRHDACCAKRGRPVAATLSERRPESVWECSHIGGDRFAPNVLVLPHGLYYGRVDPRRAHEIIEAQERSEVVPELLRGRAVFQPAVQAAQHFARLAEGGRAIDDLNPIDWRTTSSGDVTVELSHAGGRLTVTVRPTKGPTRGYLTCKATEPLNPPTFSLLSIGFDG